MSKLYENIFRSINISLVNETKIILKKLNIEISDVINAAKTKPFGFLCLFILGLDMEDIVSRLIHTISYGWLKDTN